jgi:hypothetical protein
MGGSYYEFTQISTNALIQGSKCCKKVPNYKAAALPGDLTFHGNIRVIAGL